MGAWDIKTEMAARYSWHPDWVDTLDPDFVTECSARWAAEAIWHKEELEKAKRGK